MKKLLCLVGVLLITASAINAQEQNLDQILEKHYKAAGFDKLQNVKTIISSGTITTNVIMPIKCYRVRPNKYRMERDAADITGYTVFDGQNGWTTAPWTGNPKPKVATGSALIELQAQADFDGSLYNWKAKGHKAELAGIEKVENSNAYKIKVTRKDGGVECYLIDTNSFLLLKKVSYRSVENKEIVIENLFSNYKNVQGIMFAFGSLNTQDGQFYSEIQYDTVELNQPVDDAIFVMPAK